MLEDFEHFLISDEKSAATIAKYKHDLKCFMEFAEGRAIDKTLTLQYKEWLRQEHAVSSANSMIAALNSFLRYNGWYDCCIKRFKVQRQIYCSEEKELTKAEFYRLINTAKLTGNRRMEMILQTIGGTGIRVSELEFITVEAVASGEAVVNCKGKTRTVFIVSSLRKKLKKYAQQQGVVTGPVFISRNGNPVNRSCIWREMKRLCEEAGVLESKVFPHNLRHLFARTFYNVDKDIAKLADVLGHSSINTTRIYIISTGAEHKQRMEHMKLIL